MAKQKRKLIEKLLFEVYDKGVQQNECNLTDYYEKIQQALNIPHVINRRELLVAFNKEMSELHSWFLPAEDSMIDEFLSNQ